MHAWLMGTLGFVSATTFVFGQGTVEGNGSFGVGSSVQTFAPSNTLPDPQIPDLWDKGITHSVPLFTGNRVSARGIVDPRGQSDVATGFLRAFSSVAASFVSDPFVEQSSNATVTAQLTDRFVIEGISPCQAAANGWVTFFAKTTFAISHSTTATREVMGQGNLTTGSAAGSLTVFGDSFNSPNVAIQVGDRRSILRDTGIEENTCQGALSSCDSPTLVTVNLRGASLVDDWRPKYSINANAGINAKAGGTSTTATGTASATIEISVVRTELWARPSVGPDVRVPGILRSDYGFTYLNFVPICDSIDFNNNGVFPEDQDMIDYLNVLAGGECSTALSTPCGCNDLDFNNDGVSPDDQDMVAFLNVLAGSGCP